MSRLEMNCARAMTFALALGAVASLLGCATRHQGPASDNFDGRKFHNVAPEPEGALWGFLRWQLLEPGTPWPENVEAYFDHPPARVRAGELRLSYVGHATVLVQFDGLNILTDPVWSERASPLRFAGPKRIRQPAVPFEHLPRIDVVLVSHNHYDHLDTHTLARLWERDRPLIVAPLGACRA